MEEINPNSIEVVNLGKTCPICPPGDTFNWLYAIRAIDGAKSVLPLQDEVLKGKIEKNSVNHSKVLLYHNKCKYYKLIDKDWISFVKEKISEGYILQPGVSRLALIRFEDLPPASLDAYYKEKKNGCFIATAVYGSSSTNEVLILQSFRDLLLIKHIPGRIFIATYYRISPFLARLVTKSESLKNIIKIVIVEPIVLKVKCLLERNYKGKDVI